MRFPARPGAADELAALLVRVADGLRDTPSCVSWIVARNSAHPDEVWVQELWASEAAAEAALAATPSGEGPRPADVMALCAGAPTRFDLTPIGGVGFTAEG